MFIEEGCFTNRLKFNIHNDSKGIKSYGVFSIIGLINAMFLKTKLVIGEKSTFRVNKKSLFKYAVRNYSCNDKEKLKLAIEKMSVIKAEEIPNILNRIVININDGIDNQLVS